MSKILIVAGHGAGDPGATEYIQQLIEEDEEIRRIEEEKNGKL